MARQRKRNPVADEPQPAALRYVVDSEPGIRRIRRGRHFRYVDHRNQPVADPDILQRIRSLAIPPAYNDVWICAFANGHLQATGYDARQRKQYRYHPEWRRQRDNAKFARMIEFGAALQRMRARMRQDLSLQGLPREKVLALMVDLLDTTRARIGNRQYERENDSYGLTTLNNRHARFTHDGSLYLQFRGKGGQERRLRIDERRIVRLVKRCRQLPGQHLFQYVDEAGKARSVESGDVNDYIAATMGAGFTAKDFRTWGATVEAIRLLAAIPLPVQCGKRRTENIVAEVVREVAADLGNTPTVCRKSYINPWVFDAWKQGLIHRTVAHAPARQSPRWERQALSLLRRERKYAAKTERRRTPVQ